MPAVSDFTALLSGQSWSGSPGAPMVVTFSFDTQTPTHLYDQSSFSDAFIDSFQPFSAQQQQLARQALEEWASVSGIIFVEVPPGQGDIRFSNHNFALDPRTSGFTGYGTYPTRGAGDSFAYDSPAGGHVFFNTTALGGVNYGLMLHEVGHALGLEHPFSGDVTLQSQYDNGTYTVMSYDRPGPPGLGIFDADATQYLYNTPDFTPSTTGGGIAFAFDQASMTVTQSWGHAASQIFGSSLGDVADGGAGNDTIAGFAGHDSLLGGLGDDTLFGGPGNDTLNGGPGTDRLYGGNFAGDSQAGINTVSYLGDTAGVTATLGPGNWNGTFSVNATGVGIGEDVYYDIHHAIGGAGPDRIDGSDIGNHIAGGAGFDTLSGGAGDDTLDGGLQADSLIGGDGFDSLIGGQGFDILEGGADDDTLLAGEEPDRLYGGTGNDLLYAGSNFSITVDGLFGEAGDDTLYGQAGFDYLDGGEGNDLLDGGHQADNIYGRDGNDTMRGDLGLDRLFGGVGDDFGRGGDGDDGLFGDVGNDTLYGEAGHDRFFGGPGDDYLDGGEGNDNFYAGSGFDTIVGGTGNDTMQGNFNADTFIFADGHGMDVISDFEATNDSEKVDLSAVSAIVSFADLAANHATQVGGDVVIDTGGGNSITLSGVTLADLDQADFLF